MDEMPSLQKKRLNFKPILSNLLKDLSTVQMIEGETTMSLSYQEELKKRLPHTFGQKSVCFSKGNKQAGSPLIVGVVFSGGQAPGGHNVIAGIFDAIK